MLSVCISRFCISFCWITCSCCGIGFCTFIFRNIVSYEQNSIAVSLIQINFLCFRWDLLSWFTIHCSKFFKYCLVFCKNLKKTWFSARILRMMFFEAFFLLNLNFVVTEAQLFLHFQLTLSWFFHIWLINWSFK